VVADLGAVEQRRRKLPTELSLLVSVAISLFGHQSLEDVLRKLLRRLHFIGGALGTGTSRIWSSWRSGRG